MKCKICGFEIIEGQEKCPGCGTSVESLKQAGNIEYEYVEESSEDNTQVVEQPVAVAPVEMVSEPAPVEEPVVDHSNDVQPVEEVSTPEPVIENTEINQVEEPAVVEEVPQEQLMPEEFVGITETKEVTPVSETPVAEAPVVGEVTPVSEAPVVGEVTPVAESPVVGEVTPVVETPVVEESTPVSETPVVEEATPVTETPAVEALANDTKKVKEPKKKGKLRLIIIIILVILAIIGGGIAYIHFVFGSGYNIISRTMKVMSSNATNNIKNINKNELATMNMSINYSGQMGLDFLNKTKIKLETKYAHETKDMAINVGLTYDGASLSLDTILKDKTIYLTSKDIFDKSIKIDLGDEYDEMKKELDKTLSHSEEMARVVEKVSNHISDAFKNQKFTKEYTSITVDEKSVTAAKTTLNLNKADLENLTKTIITSIANDEQLLKDISVLFNVDASDIKESLTEEIKDVIYDEKDNLKLVVYTDMTTTKFYKAELTVTSEGVSATTKIDAANNGYIIKINVPEQLDVVINTNTKAVIMTLKQGTEIITINMTYNTTYPEKIEIEAPTNAISFEEITDEDKLALTEKVKENEFIKKVAELVESMRPIDNDYDNDYELDYDYDYDFNDFDDFDNLDEQTLDFE